MRAPKNQTAVLEYLKRMPFCSAVAIQRGIKMKKGNVYTLLNRLVEKGDIDKKGKYYSLSESYDRATKVINTIKKVVPPPASNPLISVYSREIKFIEDGIDSLMITKNYLQRRIEQLELEDAKRATN